MRQYEAETSVGSCRDATTGVTISAHRIVQTKGQNMFKAANGKQRGFTLIELLVVIAIIAILI